MPFLVIVYFRNAQESNLTFLLRNLGGRFKLNRWPKDVICTIWLAGLVLIRLFPLISWLEGWKDSWFFASRNWHSSDPIANNLIPTSFQIPGCCFTLMMFNLLLF